MTEKTAERPTKGDPMLDAVLKTECPEFDAWVKSLPLQYWARYDLSACRIGWEGALTARSALVPDAGNRTGACPRASGEPSETALQRFNRLWKNEDSTDPVERLRAFCSFAMNGEDWLDVEPFFDALAADRCAPPPEDEHPAQNAPLPPASPARPAVRDTKHPLAQGGIRKKS